MLILSSRIICRRSKYGEELRMTVEKIKRDKQGRDNWWSGRNCTSAKFQGGFQRKKNL